MIEKSKRTVPEINNICDSRDAEDTRVLWGLEVPVRKALAKEDFTPIVTCDKGDILIVAQGNEVLTLDKLEAIRLQSRIREFLR